MQTPRAMWRSLPQATAQDLLADHLELRERVAYDLGVGVGGDGSLNGYFTQQQIEHQARRAALIATNVVRGLVRGLACERTMPSQWLGEYAERCPGGLPAIDDPVADARCARGAPRAAGGGLTDVPGSGSTDRVRVWGQTARAGDARLSVVGREAASSGDWADGFEERLNARAARSPA